jgi:DNA primase
MSGDVVEQIKTRLNIVEVVESYVKLQKSGKNYKARSPFTNERTPSFFVNPDQGLYYCFSSGKGGDMFTFVQEMEGVDFAGALKVLASRAGVELKPENPQVRDEREMVLAAMETATRFYESQLPKQPVVIEYLKKRGMTGKTAKDFRVGYALEDWRTLYEHLLSKGFSGPIMEKAGLVIHSEKGYYDRFRGRVMFPISNSAGKVVAFSGRLFSALGKVEEGGAKYVNSPETQVYNKSEILYGFDKAKQAIRQSNNCVFVEGQMDIVLSHQAGVINTVAVSGTGLTTFHLQQIRRLADNLIFAFDADEAGVNAAKRGIGLALLEGFEVRVVTIPNGKDPADVVCENPEIWVEAVKHSEHVIDFYLKYCNKISGDDRILSKNIEKHVLPYIAELQSPIDQAQFVAKVAETLHISEDPIWSKVHEIERELSTKKAEEKYIEKKMDEARERSRKELIEDRIASIILWQSGLPEPVIEITAVLERLGELGGNITFIQEGVLSPEAKGKMIFEAEIYGEQHPSIAKDIEELLKNFRKEGLKEEWSQLRKDLSLHQGDAQEIEILKRIQEVQKEMQLLQKSEED